MELPATACGLMHALRVAPQIRPGAAMPGSITPAGLRRTVCWLGAVSQGADSCLNNFPKGVGWCQLLAGGDVQVWVGVVPVGPSGHALNSSYQTRDSKGYK